MSYEWGKQFAKRRLPEMKKFVAEAARRAIKTEPETKQIDDGSSIFLYDKGDWQYEEIIYGDTLNGGGTVTVACCGIVRYALSFYGRTIGKCDREVLLKAQNEALSHISSAMPIRGPREYSCENGMLYQNAWNGEFALINGHEAIRNKNGKICYELYYHGGLVNVV